MVAAFVLAAAIGLELGVNEPVGLGDEGADLFLASRQDRQRRGLDATERNGAVKRRAQADCRRAGGVHSDDPVGFGARAGGLLEQRELTCRAQILKRLAHRRFGHRGEPEPLDRLL